ncbi:FGGY family carbohydrate kinase [Streptomyces sp. GESEQ-4]|uniref:FGGY family carbohydrate kinase n=1 Tax=Streptomyces sp. GESEQ-4 TaxID=2812655 RepID=UPI0027DB0DBE|nr:FGGY family carbohydrate kinase [Streptomyces sp. GESEQ-4]
MWSSALELSGTVPFSGSTATLLAWLARHEPGVLQQARWLLSCKDWLRLRLTGARWPPIPRTPVPRSPICDGGLCARAARPVRHRRARRPVAARAGLRGGERNRHP